MIEAVIIDDEKYARDFIESILIKSFPNISICAKASSVSEGIKAISKCNPDIVFLDIQLQDGTGFDILDAISEKKFELIFITAYNQHAIKAFKYSAVDYIVKPIDIEEFILGVQKIENKKISIKSNNESLNIIRENLVSNIPVKIAIPVKDGLEYLNSCEIVRFKADGRYTDIFLLDNRKFKISRTLGDFNDLIDNKTFYKTHKSHIINLNFVKKLNRKSNLILLNNNSEIPITRDKKDEFIQVMSDLIS